MSKDETNPTKPVNEVDSIRKLLFGDQVAQMEERFVSIEKSLTQLRTENRNLRQALEAELTTREQVVEELKNFILASLKERDEARDAHLLTQTDLVNALMQALGQYKQKITPSGK
jgi:uncharacterized protein YaaN involved in tellurite resistance